MRYGESWPAPQSGGGPAITPPARSRPVRDRHARVLAYEIWKLGQALSGPQTARTAGGTP